MELFRSANTCSAAEVGRLLEPGVTGGLEAALRSVIGTGEGYDRRVLVAYVADYQATNKELIAALKANKFKRVGSYAGNSARTVHMYVRGLRASRKSSKK